MRSKTHPTVSVLVKDLHRTWYLLHFLSSNLYTQQAYKKNFSFYPMISETGKLFFIYKGIEQDAENQVICLSLHSESVAAAHTGHTSLAVLIRYWHQNKVFYNSYIHMYQQHDPHNFKLMLVLPFAQKMNTKLTQCTLFKR